jgi:hypothetical protein
MPRRVLPLLLSALVTASAVEPSVWPVPIEREHKAWTRWWWLGSAVDKENITRELEAFAAAGLGGVEITPIYGAKGAEERFIPFLSPKYVEMLAHTAAEAKRLGMGVDMATGTGWPFGGKHVGRNDAELKIQIAGDKFEPVPTKFRVKRAAPGGEGWVLNPFSPDAMSRYLEPFTAALNQLPAAALRGQFHDSFEYTANWSNEVPTRFYQLHGYRLEDHLGTLSANQDTETVARIKYDYRVTLEALHLEYMERWIAWTHSRGQIARNQAHGAPANLLDLYAQSDIPETEVFGASPFPIPGYRYVRAELSKNEVQPLVNRFASSAGHVAGRKLIASETFTWLREHFHEAPSEMKPELDQLFLTGANHIFYHGSAYSPADAAWPGWLFYASTQANPRNPLWNDFAALNQYIARAQSLLQAGEPHNDFLVYWPVHDLWQRAEGWNRNFSMHGKDWLTDSSTGRAASELLRLGYSFDFVSDRQLQQTTFAGRELRTPGARYKAVIVPLAQHMPPETLERLAALAHEGATVVFLEDIPSDVPGLGRLEARRANLSRVRQSLPATKSESTEPLSFGKGRIAVRTPLNQLTAITGVAPEPAVQQGLQVLRRKTTDGILYFIANLSGSEFDGWLNLSHPGGHAVILDALSGRTGNALLKQHGKAASIYLQIAPGETRFVQLHQSAAPAASKAMEPWEVWKESGAPIELKGPWKIEFVDGGPTLPPSYSTESLGSWTAQGGAAESFAGTASYTCEFALPAEAPVDATWRLDLGDVRETARVWINGKEVGRAWSLPLQLQLRGVLKPGTNQIRIDVTNLAANRIRWMDATGKPWKNFHEINFVNIHYRPLDASGWPIQPSGLLGPVRLQPLAPFKPEM